MPLHRPRGMRILVSRGRDRVMDYTPTMTRMEPVECLAPEAGRETDAVRWALWEALQFLGGPPGTPPARPDPVVTRRRED